MKISVIITTYNSENWLKKVLLGYLYQTEKDLEIIIADEERKIIDDLKTKSLVVALAALGLNFFV